MAEKKGLFPNLFGKKKGCCCDITIEELPEEPKDQKENKDGESCCCQPEKKDK